MKRVITYHIWPRDLKYAEKLPLIMEFASKREMTKIGYSYFHLTISQYESVLPTSLNELVDALHKTPRFKFMRLELRLNDGNAKNLIIEIDITYNGNGFKIAVDATNDDVGVATHKFLQELFQLSNPPLPVAESSRPQYLQATIFLGRHFDAVSKEPSRLLKEFLTLLRFDVAEADEYRAIPIPDKVTRLIQKQDIYIGLVIGQREHDWIISEASLARGFHKHVILILEEGSNFNPTIHGQDNERILFPLQSIEKSFIKILQEFRSLGISGL